MFRIGNPYKQINLHPSDGLASGWWGGCQPKNIPIVHGSNRGEEPKNSNGSDHLFGRFAWLESRRQQHGRLEGWMDIPGDWMKDIGQTTKKSRKRKGWSSNQQFVDGIFRCYVSCSRTSHSVISGYKMRSCNLNTIIRPWAFERMAAINPCAEEFVPPLA